MKLQGLRVYCVDSISKDNELRFHDGQEVLVTDLFSIPEGFCPWAWADLRPHIMTVMSGGELPFIKPPGTLIAHCTIGFGP